MADRGAGKSCILILTLTSILIYNVIILFLNSKYNVIINTNNVVINIYILYVCVPGGILSLEDGE